MVTIADGILPWIPCKFLARLAGGGRSFVRKWGLTCVILLRWLEWGNPTILNLEKNVSTLSPELAIVPEDYEDKVCLLRFSSRGAFFLLLKKCSNR